MGLFDFLKAKNESSEPEKPKAYTLTYRGLELQYPDNLHSLIPVPNEEAFDYWMDEIALKSATIMILGDKGQGTFSFSFRILENIEALSARENNGKPRPVYALNFSQPDLLPPFVFNITQIREIPDKCVLLVSGGEVFGSESALIDFIKTCRNKKISLILIPEPSRLTDFDIGNLVDVFFFKQLMPKKKFLNKLLRDLHQKTERLFEAIRHIHGYSKPKSYVFIFCPSFDLEAIASYETPSFWSKNISETLGD